VKQDGESRENPVSGPLFVKLERHSGRALELDVFAPEAPSLETCVILLHGGAWRFGHRHDVHPYARELAKLGFTAIAAEYRLVGEAPWPAQIQDVKDAVVWARGQARSLGFAPEKIAVQGFSAGGHLALLAAGTAGRTPNGEATAGEAFGAAVALFAPSELVLPPIDAPFDPVRGLLGPGATAEWAAAASPLTHVGERFPPTCLLHGTADRLLPHRSSLTMFSALEEAGASVELHLFQGHGHEFAALPSMLEETQRLIALFLRRTLSDPAFYAAENLKLNPFAPGGAPIPNR
jgi:acetyl esterase/lipase